MRRLLAVAFLLAGLWVPVAANPPAVHAATCTGWNSASQPPSMIKVYRTNLGVVQTVDFKTYAKVVMAAEYSASFLQEALRAGAVAVKQYAWYYAMYWRGGRSASGDCYDVVDNSNDQIYAPESKTPSSVHIAAVDDTWSKYVTKSGALFLTGYRPGLHSCGSNVDGYHLSQWGAQYCAAPPYSMTADQILHMYLDPAEIRLVTQLPAAGPGTYHPLTPTRILDSRNGTGGVAGLLRPRVPRTFQVTGGTSGVPSEATSVTGILTVTGARSEGFFYIGPEAIIQPTSSSLNFPAYDDRANSVSVRLSGSGTLSITSSATAYAIFDLTGYFSGTGGSTYSPLTPKRILDTRDGTGGLAGAFSSRAPRTFTVVGAAWGVPADAAAVTGVLTITEQSGNGFLYIGPEEIAEPTSSSLNFPARDNRANSVYVRLGTGGTLSITFASPIAGATAHVVFDVTGYFSSSGGAAYVPLTPTRILDTRDGTGGLPGPFSSRAPRTLTVASEQSGVPAGATAVTGTLTVTQSNGPGFLYAGPVEMADPTSSCLNFPAWDDRANSISVKLGDGGTLSITYATPVDGATGHVIFDVTGYYVPTT